MSGPVFIPDPDALRERITSAWDERYCDGHDGMSYPNCRACAADVVLAVLAEVGVPAVEKRLSGGWRRFATLWEEAP